MAGTYIHPEFDAELERLRGLCGDSRAAWIREAIYQRLAVEGSAAITRTLIAGLSS